MTVPPDDQLMRDAEELHEALNQLVRVYQFRDRDRICCYDVSVTQSYAVETLVRKGPMRMQALLTSSSGQEHRKPRYQCS
ncbi:MarR family transcriptional regulator [Pseudomonas aeruginosa]|nr:MarR family transcriptional regulator [Pseudomonas aeruginosa]